MKIEKTFIAMLLITSHLPMGGQDAGRDGVILTEFIYQADDVPFPSCHASTIVEIENGMLAAWFGGTREKHPDVGIWLSRFTGKSWSTPVEVANGVQPSAGGNVRGHASHSRMRPSVSSTW